MILSHLLSVHQLFFVKNKLTGNNIGAFIIEMGKNKGIDNQMSLFGKNRSECYKFSASGNPVETILTLSNQQ